MSSNALASLFRERGNWSFVYLDVSGDVDDPRRIADLRRRSVTASLEESGAPADDIEAVMDALEGDPGAASPVCRFVLVKDGEVALDELLPGEPVGADASGHGPVPDLVPLMRHRPSDYPYLVVEVGHDGGEIRLYRVAIPEPELEKAMQGRTDTLKKIRGGGWAHLRYQHHVEDIWKHTMDELAQVVDRLVLDRRPRLIVAAGDPQALRLLEGQLSQESRTILATEATNTRADGASSTALESKIAHEQNRLATDDRVAALDHLRNRAGTDTAAGVGAVVTALQQAQAEFVFLDTDELGERTLLALDAAPWVATAPEDALDAAVLRRVRADLALMRAALLTDASVYFALHTELPGGAETAASLRWPTGPATPGI